jgi:hypothetical protein
MTEGERRGRPVWRAIVLGASITLAVVASACAGDDDDADDAAGTTTAPTEASTTTTVPRPEGPAADLSEELTGGDGVFVAAATEADLGGYVEEEFVAAGDASSYRAQGELTSDGEWTFETDAQAAYRTRVLVRRPADAADFSGTVVVEWLNVSGGVDANPEWATVYEEIIRAGHVWVGVSAQLIGVNGGPVAVSAPGGEGIAGEGLSNIDPERYGSLDHPGDGFAFDIYTQVARALREGEALGDLEPQYLLAAGESQSAFALVTYANGVQPLTRAFDAFFVHSRGGASLPLTGAGEYADIAGSIGRTPTIVRTDIGVPVMVLQTEGDVTSVLGSIAARQDDTDDYRLWEVAGTAHADTRLVGATAEQLDCGVPINDGPLHVVAKAALRGLDDWMRGGEPPAEAPRLETTGEPAAISRDADGIALGGVRTPPVDVPVVVLSGAPGSNPSTICLLLGSTTPLPAERIAALYESRTDYEQRFETAVDEAIDAGFVLEEDREALMEYADPSVVSE